MIDRYGLFAWITLVSMPLGQGWAADDLPRITVGTPASRTDWKQTRRETVYTPPGSTAEPSTAPPSSGPMAVESPDLSRLMPLIRKMNEQADIRSGDTAAGMVDPSLDLPGVAPADLPPEMVEQMRRMTRQMNLPEALKRINPQQTPTGGRQERPSELVEIMRQIQQRQKGQPGGSKPGNLIEALRHLEGVVDQQVMPMLKDIERDVRPGR